MSITEDLTAAGAALAQEARGRRAELDAGRTIPSDLLERAGEAGLYRQMLPVDRGGYGLTPAEWFLNGIEMARFEPSFGWIVTQTSGDLVTFVTAGSRAFADAFLADRGANTACSRYLAGNARPGRRRLPVLRPLGGSAAAARERPGWAARERSPDRSTASGGTVWCPPAAPGSTTRGASSG